MTSDQPDRLASDPPTTSGPSEKIVEAMYGVYFDEWDGRGGMNLMRALLEVATPGIRADVVAEVVAAVRRISDTDPIWAATMDIDECADFIEREFGGEQDE